MRLRLLLRHIGAQNLTANYNYPLSAAIYSLLKFGSPEFSSFLHDIGYRMNGKTYKLFSFALRFDRFKIVNQNIKLIEPTVNLIITSPLIEDFIQNFVIGTFEQQRIELFESGVKSIFEIEQVESLPPITFNGKTKFILLSPLILSTKETRNGKLQQQYYRYNSSIEEINRVLNNNLINKYELIENKIYEGNGVKLEWDSNYISRMTEKGKRLTKKVTIQKANTPKIELIGNQLPFTLAGDSELIRTGYDCGFGEKNSMGFGLAEVVK